MYSYTDPQMATIAYKERIEGRREKPITYGQYARTQRKRRQQEERRESRRLSFPQLATSVARAVSSWLL